MTATSFFSRAHGPRAHAPKRIRGFLSLPGEIRNQIYGYYFEVERHCEFAAKGCQFKPRKQRTVKLWSGLVPPGSCVSPRDTEADAEAPTLIRFSRPLGKYNVVQGLQTNWLGSLCALSLVCKQVYHETTAFLYTRTVFIFAAPKRMTNFFSNMSAIKLESITKLQLHYDTYGHPQRTSDLIWQNKHGESWHRACKAASKKLIGLQELEIWVQVHDSAPTFTLRESWVAPLLQFRRLTRSNESGVDGGDPFQRTGRQPILQVVKVHIRTRWSKSPLAAFRNVRALAKASTDLHLLYGQAISLAITGAKEEEAMAGFNAAWEGKYREWRHHLQFARTGW
ncbi:hypothetical protein BDW02DRAFT_559923 [Decorospora gaudefroyi]|uniref:DUF7730 domain-containing protein n=1 Tax=Decorospora gaudefroyi TaxID=184978 RepID=A0A6A5K1R8_9PLEO|nr:hypothetical protein BDW02DRAFT_559923 [Decorospora gaudefroyi]